MLQFITFLLTKITLRSKCGTPIYKFFSKFTPRSSPRTTQPAYKSQITEKWCPCPLNAFSSKTKRSPVTIESCLTSASTIITSSQRDKSTIRTPQTPDKQTQLTFPSGNGLPPELPTSGTVQQPSFS